MSDQIERHQVWLRNEPCGFDDEVTVITPMASLKPGGTTFIWVQPRDSSEMPITEAELRRDYHLKAS